MDYLARLECTLAAFGIPAFLFHCVGIYSNDWLSIWKGSHDLLLTSCITYDEVMRFWFGFLIHVIKKVGLIE